MVIHNYILYRVEGMAPGPGGAAAGQPAGALMLTLENEFTLTPGTKPSVNSFRIRASDYDRLKPVIGTPGTLEFWSSAVPPDLHRRDEPGTITAPDILLPDTRAADVEGLSYAYGPDGLPRFLEFRLLLADYRLKWVYPRGGTLKLGLVNSSTDNGRSYSNQELLSEALKAMGLPPVVPLTGNPPPADDGGPVIGGSGKNALEMSHPPKDLKWFNAHAMT